MVAKLIYINHKYERLFVEKKKVIKLDKVIYIFTIWMSFREVPLVTNNSNLPSISPHTPMITNAMAIVAKGRNLCQPKLSIMCLGWKNNLTKGSKGGMIVTLVAIESSMV